MTESKNIILVNAMKYYMINVVYALMCGVYNAYIIYGIFMKEYSEKWLKYKVKSKFN